MPRRRFNAREHLALWRLAGGRCEECGRPLEPGWHGDHKIPYSKGGPTDLANGAALCPPCNVKKGNAIMNPDRLWQQQFIADFEASTERDYLLVACPAAGKTLAAITVADKFRRVLVVVPQLDVKRNWTDKFSREAGRTSHDVTKDGLPIGPHDIVVVTYAGLTRYAPELGVWLAGTTGLLILDEIHHGGDADDGPTVWGRAAREVAARATRSLLLTGTPLRTGGDRIALVRYDANDEPIADHRYGFAEAWGDDPCPIRRVDFKGHDADVEWERTSGDGDAELSKMTVRDDEVAALRSALNPDGALVRDVLLDIRAEVEERRLARPYAGALIACRDQNHARAVAERMRTELRMDDLVLVLSDDDDARAAIDRFRDGSARYLVAVRMISEGVDIPRLEVLAHFTPTRSRLFIHQLIGRVLRVIDGEEYVEAIVHYPMSPTLRAEVAAIEELLTYRVRTPEDEGGGGGGGSESTFIWGTATSAVQAEVSGSFGTIDRGRIDALRVGIPGLGEDMALDVAKFLLREGTLGQVDPVARTRVETDPQTEWNNLRKERDAKVKSLAGAMARRGEHEGNLGACATELNARLKTGFNGKDPARLTTDEFREQLRILKEWRDQLD